VYVLFVDVEVEVLEVVEVISVMLWLRRCEKSGSKGLFSDGRANQRLKNDGRGDDGEAGDVDAESLLLLFFCESSVSCVVTLCRRGI
jgi:hypothetical protein